MNYILKKAMAGDSVKAGGAGNVSGSAKAGGSTKESASGRN